VFSGAPFAIINNHTDVLSSAALDVRAAGNSAPLWLIHYTSTTSTRYRSLKTLRHHATP